MKNIKIKKERRLAQVVSPKPGKPTSIKIGYRDIKLEWIVPDFRTENTATELTRPTRRSKYFIS